MKFKRFYKRAGYEGTVQRFLEGKSFVRGMMRESSDIQMLELICQCYICSDTNGYFSLCDYHKCMGVPICKEKKKQLIKARMKL